MDVMVLLLLTSGLFLGWSLGANDAANVFGTAVGTRIVIFTQAALICSVFVILGAVITYLIALLCAVSTTSRNCHTVGRTVISRNCISIITRFVCLFCSIST